MQVVEKNFQDFYDQIKSYLSDAEFVSIDFEMTGIRTFKQEMLSDIPQERYAKMASACSNKYKIIQVGLCLFTKKEWGLVARPYNIYVYPRESFGYSPQLTLDVQAMDFNSKHGMDWNKWIYEGVTYMTMKDANKKAEELEKGDSYTGIHDNGDAQIKLSKEEDIKKEEKLRKDLHDWISSGQKTPFKIDDHSRFFRKFVYELLKKEYPNLVVETLSKKDKPMEKEIYLYNMNEGEKKIHLEKKKSEKDKLLLSAKGFTNVFELLVNAKKPLVGHNMYFDLLFLYSHFVEPLPPSHLEFKKSISKLFPEIYDTKFIVNQTNFVKKLDQTLFSSSLDSLYQIIKAKESEFADIKMKLAPGFESYDMERPENAAHFHEAGFDAFLTGYCFAKMFYKLSTEDAKKVKNSVNVLKSFKYMRMQEETDPYFNDHATIYFLSEKLEENTEKLCYADVLAKLESLNLGEDLRIIIANTDTHNQAVISLETLDEPKRNSFSTKVKSLEKLGFQICTFEEQCIKAIEQQKAQKNSKYQGQYKKPYNNFSKPYIPNGGLNSQSPSNQQSIPNQIQFNFSNNGN
jgi:poly(A)-specific ribonuclease